MNPRISITLAVCIVGGAVAAVALTLPARETSTAAAPAAVATVQADATEAAAPAPTQIVNIEGFAFDGPAVVKPGEQITVSNLDGSPHSMTANDGSFDTGIIDAGGAVTLTMPTTPGTYQFFCSVHPGMVSTITVQA